MTEEPTDCGGVCCLLFVRIDPAQLLCLCTLLLALETTRAATRRRSRVDSFGVDVERIFDQAQQALLGCLTIGSLRPPLAGAHNDCAVDDPRM